MSPAWEKVFFILSWIGQGSSYIGVHAYGVMHRMHHSFADTEKDPHSPDHAHNIFDMMWKTRLIYSDVFHDRMQIEERFVKGVPKWESFEKFADSPPARIFWALLYIAFYATFATAWWMWLFLPINLIMGPLHGAIINWFAHKVGYINFKVSDKSRNLMPLDIFMMGEGYHNNHHKFGARANFGVKWHELDPTYQVIKVLNWLQVIKLRKRDPELAF